MTKVWVQVELPNGYRVRHVIAGADYGDTFCELNPIDVTANGPNAAVSGPRWEYHVLRLADSVTDHECLQNLNRLGADGWECFSNIGRFWFRRRLP